MALGMDCRLGLAYLAVVHQLLDEAVVDRDLLEHPVTVEVEPRVADVGCSEPIGAVVFLDDGEGHQGRPHPEHGPVGPGLLPNGPVGCLCGAFEGARGAMVRGFEGGFQGRDRRRGRNLAGSVPAHPISYRVQSWGNKQLVLVVRTDKTDVGRRADDQLGHLRSSKTVRPTCKRSPFCRGTGPVSLRPFTRVPLVDPRSSTQYSSPLLNTLACTCDTKVSVGSATAQPGARAMLISSSSTNAC